MVSWASWLFKFPFVFDFALSDRLPLHVRWIISAAAVKWFDVIYDVTGACTLVIAVRRTRVCFLEMCKCCLRPFYGTMRRTTANQHEKYNEYESLHSTSIILSRWKERQPSISKS